MFVEGAWAEDHHDVEVVDGQGRRLVRCRLEEGASGIAAARADHLDEQAEAAQVVVGIETGRPRRARRGAG